MGWCEFARVALRCGNNWFRETLLFARRLTAQMPRAQRRQPTFLLCSAKGHSLKSNFGFAAASLLATPTCTNASGDWANAEAYPESEHVHPIPLDDLLSSSSKCRWLRWGLGRDKVDPQTTLPKGGVFACTCDEPAFGCGVNWLGSPARVAWLARGGSLSGSWPPAFRDSGALLPMRRIGLTSSHQLCLLQGSIQRREAASCCDVRLQPGLARPNAELVSRRCRQKCFRTLG